VRFEIYTAVRMMIFWVLAPYRLVGRCLLSEKQSVSIFRAELAMLRSGGIYIGAVEGKAEGVGQSGTRNEEEKVLGQ
jgi:hypothetical protein